MKKLYFFMFAFFFCLVGQAQADSSLMDNISGTYKGKGEGQGKIILKLSADKEKIKGNILVNGGKCNNLSADAVGSLSGDVLTLKRMPEKDEGTEFGDCIFTVTFDKSGKNATISEDNCLAWHGNSCEFEGKVSKKGK